MNFSEFVGQVQHRIELSAEGEALRATRGVLTTLGERLGSGEVSDLAAPLPMEIDRSLETAESGQRFGYDKFADQVAERTGADQDEAIYSARVVVDLLGRVVPNGELDEVRAQLPDEFEPLFGLTD